jgi:YegS/Rv2252/BmrU family lipid kinase
VTTALLIRNPVSGKALREADARAVLEVARAAGWRIEAVSTERAGHATEIAREAAARGVDVAIVHGGDGTINEVVNGIAGSETALAVLRGGTANVWAKETQCAKDPIASMRVITRGVRRRVDLGRAGDRYFLLMAGVGLDAAIVPRVSARMKRRLGAAAYILAGVITALRTRAWAVDMRRDGAPAETSLYWLVASNTRSYGSVVQIARDAVADDGLLEIVHMRRGGVISLAAAAARLLCRRLERSPNVRFQRLHELSIETAGIPVQVDGEPHGTTPMRLAVAPGALAVIVPAGLQTPLFATPPASPAR